MSTQVSGKRSLVEAAAWLSLVAAVAAVAALLFHGCSDPVKVANENEANGRRIVQAGRLVRL